MCGRYALYGPHSRLREKFLLEHCPEYAERYNIAPQSDILIIRAKPGTGRVGQFVRWGLIPSWATDSAIGNKLTNARGETVAEKPSFRISFARHRCLIPIKGFYEWSAVTIDGKVRKQPYYSRCYAMTVRIKKWAPNLVPIFSNELGAYLLFLNSSTICCSSALALLKSPRR